MSLYDDLGRETGIGVAVDAFYRKVLADPDLSPYFEGVDMARLRRHQALLLVQVAGGPAAYDGRGLAEAHQPLGITSEHFDRVVEHLATTLRELGASDDTIGQVAAALAVHRDEIVASDPVVA